MPPRYPEAVSKMFKARPRPRFVKHDEPETKSGLTGLGAAFSMLSQMKLPDAEPTPTILPVKERRILEREKRMESHKARMDAERAEYHPAELQEGCDPYNALFLSGIDSSVTEQQIRYEFSVFGPIKSVTFVHNRRTGERKPYCFLEYEKPESFNSAMSQGRRVMINGKPIIVDCERGHTVTNWVPRRLGGGYGDDPRRFTPSKEVLEVLNPKRKFKGRYNTQEMPRRREDRPSYRRTRRFD